MTATSAHSADGTSSTANPLRDLVASLRTVQLPGSPATYANRATLRAIGLRWDTTGHRWHGTTTAERVKELRERLGLEVRCFGDLEAPPKGPAAPKPAPPGPPPSPALVPIAVPARDLARRPHDGSRTRVEARTVYRADEEDGVANSRFSERDITSGLPDDSREADEKDAARRLRDVRGRVKRARAVVAITPGLKEILTNDWRKAARFFARFEITEAIFRWGAPANTVETQGDRLPTEP